MDTMPLPLNKPDIKNYPRNRAGVGNREISKKVFRFRYERSCSATPPPRTALRQA